MVNIQFFGVYFLFLFFISTSFRLNKMWQIGHRGFPDKFGDNNMVSFTEAHRIGFDMIELDIQLDKHDNIMIMHDIHIDYQFVETMSYEEIMSHKAHETYPKASKMTLCNQELTHLKPIR